MDWKSLLRSEAESTYRAAEGLMDLVDADALDFKPRDGGPWMDTKELLRHLTDACGWCCERFVKDDWAAVMDGTAPSPPSDVGSVADAKRLLVEDRDRMLALVDGLDEETLATRMVAAPWDPTPRPLGQHLLGMIAHLAQHKGQLFYYLKLQGKPVDTWKLYGIPEPSAPPSA